MSLSITGIIRVNDDPQVNPTENGGAYFNFTAEGKDRKKKGGRFYYKVGLYVPAQKLNEAREEIVRGSNWQICHADLAGSRSQKDPNYIYNHVQTSWWDITKLIQTMHGDVQ
jgi:hypothetical protein